MNNLAERLSRMSPERRRYTLQTLPTHLADAGQGERLQCVLTDFNFLQIKMEALGLSCMIQDYDLAFIPDLLSSATAQHLRLVRDTIRLAIHILAQETAQLVGQLLGRLMVNEAFEPLREQAKQWKSSPWLAPFASAGGGMSPSTTNAFGVRYSGMNGQGVMHTSHHQPNNMWQYASNMVERTLASSMAAMVAKNV